MPVTIALSFSTLPHILSTGTTDPLILATRFYDCLDHIPRAFRPLRLQTLMDRASSLLPNLGDETVHLSNDLAADLFSALEEYAPEGTTFCHDEDDNTFGFFRVDTSRNDADSYGQLRDDLRSDMMDEINVDLRGTGYQLTRNTEGDGSFYITNEDGEPIGHAINISGEVPAGRLTPDPITTDIDHQDCEENADLSVNDSLNESLELINKADSAYVLSGNDKIAIALLTLAKEFAIWREKSLAMQAPAVQASVAMVNRATTAMSEALSEDN